jgi:hypothetical protein
MVLPAVTGPRGFRRKILQMQTVVLQLHDNMLIEAASQTGSQDATIDVHSAILVGSGPAREQVIAELMDSIVERYGEAFDRLGREPRP